MKSNAEIVALYFKAVNAEDYTALSDLFHPEAELRPCGAGVKSGRDAVIAFYARVFAQFPVHADTPTRVIGAAETIVVEIKFSGETNTAQKVGFDALDVFDFKDGMIVRLSQWFDSADLARRLSG